MCPGVVHRVLVKQRLPQRDHHAKAPVGLRRGVRAVLARRHARRSAPAPFDRCGTPLRREGVAPPISEIGAYRHHTEALPPMLLRIQAAVLCQVGVPHVDRRDFVDSLAGVLILRLSPLSHGMGVEDHNAAAGGIVPPVNKAVGALEKLLVRRQIEPSRSGIAVCKVDDAHGLDLALLHAVAEFLPVALDHLACSSARLHRHVLCERRHGRTLVASEERQQLLHGSIRLIHLARFCPPLA